MALTFTLPKSLLEETRSLCSMEVEELLDDTELLELLLAEFQNFEVPAPEGAVDRAMAYSASHEVTASQVLKGNHVIFLN